MDQETRRLLDRMLRSQAYRELGAVRLFAGAAAFAPDEEGRRELRLHEEEERAHLEAVLDLWADVTGRPRELLLGEAEARLHERPLPPVQSWVDVALARFLYDRAGSWQLGELRACAHEPYARLVHGILDDEAGHQEVGAQALATLCADAQVRAAAQAALPGWLRAALLSFGRPGSPDSARAIALGLKRRDPAAVIDDFLADVRPTLQAAGLTVPAWGSLQLAR